MKSCRGFKWIKVTVMIMATQTRGQTMNPEITWQNLFCVLCIIFFTLSEV